MPRYIAALTIVLLIGLVLTRAARGWLMLLYAGAGAWLINRQALREEAFLKQHYGRLYEEYCRRVRRYL